MDATIKVTINLPVSFTSIDIDDVSFDHSEAVCLIETELEAEESKDAIISEINDAGYEWECDKAYFITAQRRDAR